MRVIKPMKLGVLHRPFEQGGRIHLSVGVFVFFAFDAPDRPLPEAEMWQAIATAVGEGSIFDEGMPKPGSEWLVHGAAFAPNGVAKPALTVEANVAGHEKKLYVVGDRRWSAAGASDPKPFTQMPVAWTHAFGGEGFAQNPLGKGIAATKDGHPLPNVENPKRLLQGPDDRPPPAGFSSVDFSAPTRQAFAGTYDEAWQKTRYPGYPDDLDLKLFHMAPEDQWLPERLVGREEFSVLNMHAEEPRVSGRVPHLVARCWLRMASDAGDEASAELREVPLAPETLHLLPNDKCGVLIYRGLSEIAEDDAADVAVMMLALEDPSAPKPLSHYRRVLAQRSDRDEGFVHALRESDLLPASEAEESPFDVPEDDRREGVLLDNQRRRAQAELDETRAQLVALGHDPDALGVPQEIPAPEPVDLARLDEVVANARREADDKRAEAETKRAELEQQARAEAERAGIDFDERVEAMRREQAGPPKYRAEAELAKLQDMLQLSRNSGVALPEVEAQLADPNLFTRLQEIEERLQQTYRDFAQHFPAAASLAGDEAERVRQEVLRARDRGDSLRERDLTGAALSDLDLSGLDLERALLEGADLSGCNLAGANLAGAVLTRAKLARADLRGAKLVGANLAAATLSDAKLAGADLTDAKLDGVTLTGIDMAKCRLSGVSLQQAELRGARWAGCVGEGLTLVELDASGADFRGADLSRCTFVEATLDDADLREATLTKGLFYKCSGKDVRFDKAQAKGFLAVNASSFPRARFTGACLDEAHLRGTSLAEANLDGAAMASADLSSCDLSGASLKRATAKGALLIRTDLSRADMRGFNGMQALLGKANLSGARVEGANLFRADLARVQVDGDTSFADTVLDQARVIGEGPVKRDG